MKAPTEKEMVEALLAAYNLGAEATKKVNFGRNGFTDAMARKERTALNRVLKRFGAAALTDDEYRRFGS